MPRRRAAATRGPAVVPAAARADERGRAESTRTKGACAITAVPRSTGAPRDRAATEERILQSVGEVLARDGFSALGINAIAKQAGVDKVLIYRYYGGLPELLRAWGDSGRFWPSVAELLQREPGLPQLPPAERYARFFEHFIDELRARPLTLEVLAAEVNDRNELTAILETEREQWGEEAGRVLGGAEFAASPHAPALTVLLVAGVQHLLVRARKLRVFGGFELRTDAAWDEFKRAIRGVAAQLLESASAAGAAGAGSSGARPAARVPVAPPATAATPPPVGPAKAAAAPKRRARPLRQA